MSPFSIPKSKIHNTKNSMMLGSVFANSKQHVFPPSPQYKNNPAMNLSLLFKIRYQLQLFYKFLLVALLFSVALYSDNSQFFAHYLPVILKSFLLRVDMAQANYSKSPY